MVELRGGHPAQPLTIEGLRLTDERIDAAVADAVHRASQACGARMRA